MTTALEAAVAGATADALDVALPLAFASMERVDHANLRGEGIDSPQGIVLHAMAYPDAVVCFHVAVDTDLFSDDHYVFLQFSASSQRLHVVHDVRVPDGYPQEHRLVHPNAFVCEWSAAIEAARLPALCALLQLNNVPDLFAFYHAADNGACKVEIDAVTTFFPV